MAGSACRIVTIGAAFSANKGSASMLYALLDHLPARLGRCHFQVLTTYPEEDRRERPAADIQIVPYRPWELVFPLLPLALLVALVRRFGARGRWLCRHPALRAIAVADVVVDVAGISFVAGRGTAILAYNTLMTGIPLLLGARVVKAAQALGPFDGPALRVAARTVLPRLSAVVARGRLSAEHLAALGLRNATTAPDLAFAMELPPAAREEAARVLDECGVGEAPVALIPSAVVEEYCRARGVDYAGRLAALVERATGDGRSVLVLAHAARPGKPASRMNDLPLVRGLRERIASERLHVVDRSLPPDVLRALIAHADQLVTSRFHAMISALAVGTPVLVVGWSHKYAEVLDELGLVEWTLDYSQLGGGALLERFDELVAASPEIRETIARRLPALRAAVAVNFAAVAAATGREREILDP